MGVACFCQCVPVLVVLGDGQGFEHGQTRLLGFCLKPAQSVGFGGAVVRILRHKHEGGGLAVALQGLAHAARLCALAAKVGDHVGKCLTVNGAFGHHSNVRATRLCGGLICFSSIFKWFEAQGKGNRCSLRPAFHIEVAVVGTSQFPCTGEGQRRSVARRNARASVGYRKEQVAGVGGFGYAPYRKVYRAPRGGAHGTFEQQAQGFAQNTGLSFIHMPKQGGHVPRQANARIFRRSDHGIVGFAHKVLQVEGRALFANAGLILHFAGIVENFGKLARSVEHVFCILAHGWRQRAVTKGRALAKEPVERRAQHIFPHAGVHAGSGSALFGGAHSKGRRFGIV